MEINKQLFEDVLSGKLKGTFVLRNGNKVKSSELEIRPNANVWYYPISLNGIWYTFRGELHLMKSSDMDIINFISDTNMKENELTIEIPEGQEIDWQESAKQEKIVFKKKDTGPRSWEEYCKQHRNEPHFVSGYDVAGGYSSRRGIYESGYCTVPSKELAEAFLTMMQIMSLRHDWIHKWSVDNGMTDDWKPNWNIDKYKYCITILDNHYTVDKFIHYRQPLSFPTREMAEDFMNTFKDLLEIAKPLV